MALQGDLSSFALADVLRLLAGTAKTGALEVSSTSGSGEVWMREGSVVGGAVPGAPHASRAADVVLELLRFNDGSFVFDDLIDVTEEGGTSVEETLTDAESLLAEWHEVEQVVPTMDAWATLAPELHGDDVTVSADDWRVLAVIAGGVSVSGLAAMQALTDLAASRQVKALVEQGVVAIHVEDRQPVAETAAVAFAEQQVDPIEEAVEEIDPDEASADSLADDVADDVGHPDDGSADDLGVDTEPIHQASDADLAMLRSDDRPVVLEAADGPMLVEPLPGDVATFVEFEDDPAAVAQAQVERAPVMAGGGESELDEDDERGSLLRFLSTTKP